MKTRRLTPAQEVRAIIERESFRIGDPKNLIDRCVDQIFSRSDVILEAAADIAEARDLGNLRGWLKNVAIKEREVITQAEAKEREKNHDIRVGRAAINEWYTGTSGRNDEANYARVGAAVRREISGREADR